MSHYKVKTYLIAIIFRTIAQSKKAHSDHIFVIVTPQLRLLKDGSLLTRL
jgi:hypothetical protein